MKFVAPGVKPSVRIWAEECERPRLEAEGRETGTMEPALDDSALRAPHSAFVKVWIEDNGIGIPKNAQEKVFHIFQRMHHESEYPGTGIGLAIVKKAVERMGGHVGFDSEPGKGTRFCVELPRPAENMSANRRQETTEAPQSPNSPEDWQSPTLFPRE